VAKVDIDWERLARAETHPLRISALQAFAADPKAELSAKLLSDQLDVPLGNVAYHLNGLARAGVIELASTHQRRGALEKRYRLAKR
jgi:DNA-binding transcriptional ArsR family regulator